MQLPAPPALRVAVRNSIFWRVAGILIGAQLLTGLVAVGITVWIAASQSVTLIQNSVALQLNNVAAEMERNAEFAEDGSFQMPSFAYLDLTGRLKDPIFITDRKGEVLSPEQFAGLSESDTTRTNLSTIPIEGLSAIQNNNNFISFPRSLFRVDQSWGITPFFYKGELAGAIYAPSLRKTLEGELSSVQQTFVDALLIVLLIGGVVALMMGGILTWRLVTPVRKITEKVEAIGQGNYQTRIQQTGHDELGRLAGAVNQMAAEVETSVEALRTTDQVRRELIANIGHDLRTPIAAVLGNIEEAERHTDVRNPVAARDALKTAREQAQYLNRLLQDLFELSLLDAGHYTLRRESIPISELLHEAARGHRRLFTSAGLELVLEIPSGLPPIQADGLRLLRVLDNLLSNARRHTTAGGTVTLGVQRHTHLLSIFVRDTGSGMSEEELKHVFERYYRGGDARTRGAHGTGLGLAISKAITEAHGGQMIAASIQGKGSTFTIQLPLHPAEPLPTS
ncbi:MAG: HAMP domain-containing histidine kinase [Bacteroidetes Order II. Incertae sedis bacterium]|nr:HAMP domain-containing histidine kinase [Bacteroidetes Order II. bacterium]